MAGRAKENLSGGSLKYQFVYLKNTVVPIFLGLPIQEMFLSSISSTDGDLQIPTSHSLDCFMRHFTGNPEIS